ncbi:MAG: hypothetical protein OEV94_04770 [Deltaproteobacteria bacterium]|nr:hypothetical protein [Deltaproteobacteria bacterium]
MTLKHGKYAWILMVFILAGCGGGKSNNNPGPSLVSGGQPLTFNAGDTIPELKATPLALNATLADWDTLQISLQVDSATKYVSVGTGLGSSGFVGGTMTKTVQPNTTVTLNIPLNPNLPGGYYGLNVCLSNVTNPGTVTTYIMTCYRDNGTTTETVSSYAPGGSAVVTITYGFPFTNYSTSTTAKGDTAADPVPFPSATDFLVYAPVNGTTHYQANAGGTAGRYMVTFPSTFASRSITMTDGANSANTCTGTGGPFQCVLDLAGTGKIQMTDLSGSGFPQGADATFQAMGAASTTAAPNVIAANTVYVQAVPSGKTDYYSVPVTSGVTYDILAMHYNGTAFTITQFTTDATFTTAGTCAAGLNPGNTYFKISSCRVTPAANGTLYFSVAPPAGSGSHYWLSLQQVPAANDGTLAAPVAVTVNTAKAGKVISGISMSYYRAGTVNTGLPLTVTLSGLSSAAMVELINTNNGTLLCSSGMVDFNVSSQGSCTVSTPTASVDVHITGLETGANYSFILVQ